MNGNTEYRKDQMGPAAVHNLYVQMNELREIRERIATEGTDSFLDYIENTIGRDDSTRKHAHRVVNEALGGYF